MTAPGGRPGPVAGPWIWRATGAVATHPSLWSAALVQVGRLAPSGWWRRRPFLPLPDPAYLRFRLETAYGDGTRPPDPADIVTYLRWCRSLRSPAGERA